MAAAQVPKASEWCDEVSTAVIDRFERRLSVEIGAVRVDVSRELATLRVDVARGACSPSCCSADPGSGRHNGTHRVSDSPVRIR